MKIWGEIHYARVELSSPRHTSGHTHTGGALLLQQRGGGGGGARGGLVLGGLLGGAAGGLGDCVGVLRIARRGPEQHRTEWTKSGRVAQMEEIINRGGGEIIGW